MPSSEFDVAVVGGGPAGSAAAKRCAESGLSTVIVEMHRLPRDKVCTGMIMSEMAQSLIRQEFGDFPPGILTTPAHIRGLMLHLPGAGNRTVEQRMPLAWRKDLDSWLIEGAAKAGSVVFAGARFSRLTEEDGRYQLDLDGGAGVASIRSRYVIGADGTTSAIRTALFPGLQMRCYPCARECYEATPDLDTEYVHYFYLPDLVGFGAHRKGDLLLVEAGLATGIKPSEVLARAREFLSREVGLDRGLRPIRTDGCVEPLFHRELFSGSFSPAKGNALLVGNAAGLAKPITGEGIGTAIRSGLEAGDAVAKAAASGKSAAEFYLQAMNKLLPLLEAMYPAPGKLREQAGRGGNHLLDEYQQLYERSLRIL